jgi:hypothetical protein
VRPLKLLKLGPVSILMLVLARSFEVFYESDSNP